MITKRKVLNCIARQEKSVKDSQILSEDDKERILTEFLILTLRVRELK